MVSERQYDIIIVGAGILGATSAYHLIKNNPSKKILVVERYGGAANGNTGRSNAMFRNTFTSKDNQLLSDASIDSYLSLQDSGTDIGIRLSGYLWLLSENQLSSNLHSITRMSNDGIGVKTIAKEDLTRSVPTLNTDVSRSEEARLMQIANVEGAVFGEKCGRLDAVRLTEHYLQLFRKLGGRVSFGTSVESLIVKPRVPLGIDGEPFVWQDSEIVGMNVSGNLDGEILSDTVVIACGAWNNDLLEKIGIDGHVKAKKRQIFRIQASGDEALMKLMQNDSFNRIRTLPFVILPKNGCFIKALPESKEFWVACDDDFNREYMNNPSPNLDQVRAEPDYYAKSVNPILREYFSEFKDKAPKSMWAGLYSYNTLDYLPFVFSEHGAIVVGGDSGSGIMKGDSLGRIVASVYADSDQAELFGNRFYSTSKLGFARRDVEREEWVI